MKLKKITAPYNTVESMNWDRKRKQQLDGHGSHLTHMARIETNTTDSESLGEVVFQATKVLLDLDILGFTLV